MMWILGYLEEKSNYALEKIAGLPDKSAVIKRDYHASYLVDRFPTVSCFLCVECCIMAAFYVHRGKLWDVKSFFDDEWTVSVGTLIDPKVIHFKTQGDTIAYCSGHWTTLNDQKIKDRYQYISSMLDSDIRDVVFPKWIGFWRMMWCKIKAIFSN